MELLKPSSPPRLAADRFVGITPRVSPRSNLNPTVASPSGGIGDGLESRVYVAVGKSADKTAALLRWTFRHFQCREVWLFHVHQPSATIPTLLGRLPVSQANDGLVSAYRKVEREDTKKALLSYLTICYREQVQGKIIMTEAGQITEGILDVLTKHKIHKLVMGEMPDSCFKVKGRSSLTTYIAKKAPPFCEIWFVGKGKVVWTREANEFTNSQLIDFGSDASVIGERFRPSSLQSHFSEVTLHQEFRCSSLDMEEARNIVPDAMYDLELSLSPSIPSTPDTANLCDSRNSTSLASASSFFTSPVDGKSMSPLSIQELDMEVWRDRVEDSTMDNEKSKQQSFNELEKHKELEAEMAKALSRDKAFDAARVWETKLRRVLDDQLSVIKQQQRVLVHQTNETMRELEDTTRNVMILSRYAEEVDQRRDKAAEQLDLIQASVMALNVDKRNVQAQREVAIKYLEEWRYKNPTRFQRCKRVIDYGANHFNFTTISFSDLQAATCEFSECFKLSQGGYGSVVYKGEIFSRTVAIKKLDPHNVYGQSEFQQEVYVLSKLRHPHLVSLIGVCPEALSLVYEYLPNGTLHDHLFCRTSTTTLTWRTRAGIAVQISSALLFLHSSKPEKIIHGDLKPKNIFLDSDFNCKIGDFRICRLVPEETRNCPLFSRITKPQGLFPYADPECQKTGDLTPKSDAYAFGIIVLQLLTAKPPLGLANEVRRAISCGTLPSLLDQTAGEWPVSVATKLAKIGLQCAEMNSRDRLELTPGVVKELEDLHIMKERSVPSLFLCPILQEIMHDPQVAADGFTYEGSAMRGWLQNGRNTSPMTNMKLEHLNLIPNHALRFAIQDWLCQS